MTLISSLPLEELCEMYNSAWTLKLAKVRHPDHFPWKIETLEGDMNLLFEAMENKIPDTHRWEIEAIKQGLTTPVHNIKPGTWYRYPNLKWNTLQLQVVEEGPDNLWRCRMYINKCYINSMWVKSHTILTHYQLQP